MKKVFKVKDLDCANCAAKMQRGIEKIDGVKEATVNFMGQKITLEADDDKFTTAVETMIRVCKKIEPGCIIEV